MYYVLNLHIFLRLYKKPLVVFSPKYIKIKKLMVAYYRKSTKQATLIKSYLICIFHKSLFVFFIYFPANSAYISHNVSGNWRLGVRGQCPRCNKQAVDYILL